MEEEELRYLFVSNKQQSWQFNTIVTEPGCQKTRRSTMLATHRIQKLLTYKMQKTYSSPAKSEKASIFWVCTSHWLENFHCHSMLATPIGVTARVAVCSRSGAHFRNYHFSLWTWQYRKLPKYDWQWYISTSKIKFKDYGKKQNVSNKYRKETLTFTITNIKH